MRTGAWGAVVGGCVMGWVFRLVGAVVVVVAVAFGALLLVPADRVAALATDRFEAMTGRKLTIEGAVRPSLWPVLGVETGRVTLSNAPWSDAGPMVVAEGLSIRLDLAALVGGTVRITGLGLTRPAILLERSAQGAGNWEFAAAGADAGGGAGGDAGDAAVGTAPAGGPGSAARRYAIDLLSVTGGSLRYVDHGSGQGVELGAVAATASLPDQDGALGFDLEGMIAGQAVAAKGSVGLFSQALAGGVVPVDIGVTVGSAGARFAGRGGLQPLAAEGQLDAELGDLSAVAALSGMDAPALPEGLGARSVSLSGKVTRSGEGGLYLRGGRIALDGTVFEGDLDLDLAGDRPRLSGKLAAAALETGQAAGGKTKGGGAGGGGGAAVVAAARWSDAPLPVSGLRAADVDLSLSLGALRIGAVRATDVAARVTVDAGRAVIALGRASAYGGAVSGQVVVNARKALSVGAKLEFAGVDLQPLLTDVAGYDRLVAKGDLTVDAVAGGASVAALMRGLDGTGRLALGAGEIRGIDVAAILATLDPSRTGPAERTVFDSLGAGFRIARGDLFSDDLKLQSPYVRASGSGRVGIGAQDIDYRLRATALQGADGADRIVVPVMITGAWAKPEVTIDVEALAKQKLGAQAEAAGAELRRRAGKELGRKKGESLEDAAKRRLQEELDGSSGDLLQQLLGGN